MACRANPESTDYYEVLGVDRTASAQEIAKAYKRLALQHHPDKNPDNRERAEEVFKKVSEAYEVLHDHAKRQAYDQQGKATSAGGQGPEGCGVHFQTSGMSSEAAEAMFRSAFGGQDPFASFFGGADDWAPLFGGPGGPFGGVGGLFGGGRGGPPGGSVGRRARAGGGFFHRSRSRRGSLAPDAALPTGTRVVVCGLARAVEHNGAFGSVASWDEAKGRYEVELEGGNALSLRPAHLTQTCEVEIVGVRSKPELNGETGEVFQYDEASGRYTVKFSNHVPASLKRANCILSKGTRVVVTGLAKAEFNGQMARIDAIDLQACRYVVRCQNGRVIKISFGNVVC